MDRRVVITGIGGICGLGTNASSIWKEMRDGRSAISPIITTDLYDMEGTVGAEIKAIPTHDIPRKQLVSMDRFSLLAVIAATEAMRPRLPQELSEPYHVIRLKNLNSLCFGTRSLAF